MTKSQANSYSGVRKKLMGAVAMLLVASIMVVSSTYAWFTLSTAPEITGISTSVGANGNLEIALLNSSTAADMSTITSAVGDSSDATGRTAKEANITWGNLVDLSDASYGTSKFVLNPARLNLNGAANALNRAASLMVAEYGTDGRVTKLNGNTITGLYNGTVFAGESEANVDPYGVRAIGVAAGMSEAQIAFRNARITAASKLLSASNGMATALSNNGAALVNTIIAYANSESSYAPSESDIGNINAIITAVRAAKTNIGDAIRYAQYAYSLSNGETNPLEPTEAGIPEKYTSETEPLDAFQTSVNEAIDAYDAITVPALLIVETAEKDDVETALDALVNRTNCVIGGKTYADLAAMEKDALMNWGIANIANITVVMNSDNTGALASVAAASANYSAGVAIPGLTVPMGEKSIAIGDAENPIHATLRTEKTSRVTGMSAGLASMSAPAATGDAVTNITDIYGYAVDFAVRTNAADSTLKLQTAAAQRIYSDATSEETTQGGGSYMEFTKDDTLNDTQFEALIGAVRVVFVNGNNEIIAVAVPDAGTLGGATVKAELKLVNYTIDYSEDSSNNGNNGKINVMTNGAVNYKTGDDKADLMTLNQNEATKLTALVYLDGDVVDNSMVSATNAQSMTGKLNLQFASSADLKPMEYTPLRSATESAQQNP